MDLLEFYGLKEDPFKLTPDPMFFFPSASHNEALLSLNYVVQQKEGFCLVTGEPGMGKTTILNVFKESWKDKAELALILTPRLSPEEFLLAVLEDLNVKLTRTNKNDILKAFRDFLIEKSQEGKSILIIVDEAQDLPDETLEELRLLSNLETEKEKLLQIILIGQPELEGRLKKSNLRQLNQRITVKVRLCPLSGNEVLEYINYRLVKAGKGFLKLDEKLLKPIYRFSKGIPRIINILSSRAIMSAYLDGSNIITEKHVRYAIRHLKDGVLNRETTGRPKLVYALYLLAAFIIAGAGIFFYYMTPHLGRSVEQKSVETETRQGAPVQSQQPRETAPEQKKQKKTATVIINNAYIRATSSPDSEGIEAAKNGTVIEITDEFTETTGKKWYKVRLPDGKEGWIADNALHITTGDR